MFLKNRKYIPKGAWNKPRGLFHSQERIGFSGASLPIGDDGRINWINNTSLDDGFYFGFVDFLRGERWLHHFFKFKQKICEVNLWGVHALIESSPYSFCIHTLDSLLCAEPSRLILKMQERPHPDQHFRIFLKWHGQLINIFLNFLNKQTNGISSISSIKL